MTLTIVSVMLLSCIAFAQPVPISPNESPRMGCSIVEDVYGEREVCDTYYYISDLGVVYWDTYYLSWVGGGYYTRAYTWYPGFWPNYYSRYGSYYRFHNWYNSHGYRGYYGHHWSSNYGGHGYGRGYGGYRGGHGRR